MSREPKYSTETILRYRELQKEHYFRRKITAWIPVDLGYDQVALECGHKETILVAFKENFGEVYDCEECAKAWLKGNA